MKRNARLWRWPEFISAWGQTRLPLLNLRGLADQDAVALGLVTCIQFSRPRKI